MGFKRRYGSKRKSWKRGKVKRAYYVQRGGVRL